MLVVVVVTVVNDVRCDKEKLELFYFLLLFLLVVVVVACYIFQKLREKANEYIVIPRK